MNTAGGVCPRIPALDAGLERMAAAAEPPYPLSLCLGYGRSLVCQGKLVLTALKRLDHRSCGLRPTFEGERPREPWTSLLYGIICANPRHLSCRNERLTMLLSRLLWTHPRKLWNGTRKRLDFAAGEGRPANRTRDCSFQSRTGLRICDCPRRNHSEPFSKSRCL